MEILRKEEGRPTADDDMAAAAEGECVANEHIPRLVVVFRMTNFSIC